MKRLLIILLILPAALLLAGCGPDEQDVLADLHKFGLHDCQIVDKGGWDFGKAVCTVTDEDGTTCKRVFMFDSEGYLPEQEIKPYDCTKPKDK